MFPSVIYLVCEQCPPCRTMCRHMSHYHMGSVCCMKWFQKLGHAQASEPLDGAVNIMQNIRQMFSPGCVLLNLRQRVFHVEHLKSMLAPVCQVVPSASHATHFTNRPTCIFIAITPTGCWVAARFAAQLQHLVHLWFWSPGNAIWGILV